MEKQKQTAAFQLINWRAAASYGGFKLTYILDNKHWLENKHFPKLWHLKISMPTKVFSIKLHLRTIDSFNEYIFEAQATDDFLDSLITFILKDGS